MNTVSAGQVRKYTLSEIGLMGLLFVVCMLPYLNILLGYIAGGFAIKEWIKKRENKFVGIAVYLLLSTYFLVTPALFGSLRGAALQNTALLAYVLNAIAIVYLLHLVDKIDHMNVVKKVEDTEQMPEVMNADYKNVHYNSAIALNKLSKTIFLLSGDQKKTYSFDEIREWSFKKDDGYYQSTFNGTTRWVQGAPRAFFYVKVRDINHPDWTIEFDYEKRNDLNRWMEIFQQNLNEGADDQDRLIEIMEKQFGKIQELLPNGTGDKVIEAWLESEDTNHWAKNLYLSLDDETKNKISGRAMLRLALNRQRADYANGSLASSLCCNRPETGRCSSHSCLD